MEIKRYEDMDLQALDVMREIGSIGTSHAATALSKLLQKEVRISIPSVNIILFPGAGRRRLKIYEGSQRSNRTERDL